jgi:hypothetical protein
MDTIREQIIQEFLARAALVLISGGYATDIGGTVCRARLRIDPAEAPCLVVIPQPEEAENKNGRSLHRMPIVVQGISDFMACVPSLGTDPAAVASIVGERIHGDLIACFATPNWDRRILSGKTYLPALADSIVYQGGGIEQYPEEGDTTVGAIARLMVSYWTRVGDPYSQ